MFRMRFSFPAPPIPTREKITQLTSSTDSDHNVQADSLHSRRESKHQASDKLTKPTIGRMPADLMVLPLNLYHSSALEEIIRDWNPEFTTLVSLTTPKSEEQTAQELMQKECYHHMSSDVLGSLIRSMVPNEIRLGEFYTNSEIFSAKVVGQVNEDNIADSTNIPHSSTDSLPSKRHIGNNNDFCEEIHFNPSIAPEKPKRKMASKRRNVERNRESHVTDEERELISILISHLGETNVDTTSSNWFDNVMSKGNIALRGLDIMLQRAKSDSEKARRYNVFLQNEKKSMQTELYQSMVEVSVTKQSRCMLSEGSLSLQFLNPISSSTIQYIPGQSLESSRNTPHHSQYRNGHAVRQVPILAREPRMPYIVDRRRRSTQLPQLLPIVQAGNGIRTNSLLHNSSRYIAYDVPLKKSCLTGVLSNKAKSFDSKSQGVIKSDVEVITLD